MHPHVRDGLFATVVGGVALAALSGLDATPSLARPTVAAVGVAGALAVEAVFLTWGPAGERWEDRRVQAGAVASLLGASLVLTPAFGPVVLATVCWGLATFLALVTLSVAGLWPPVSE